MQRILWMKGGGLGDFVLGLPVLIALRRHYVNAEIEAVGPSAWLPLARGWADKLVPLDSPEWEGLYGGGLKLPPRLSGLDLAILLRPDSDGRMASNLRAAGVSRVLQRSPVPSPGVHQADNLGRVLEPLGIRCDPWPLVFGHEPTHRSPGRRSGPVAVHPGSGGEGKVWPQRRFVRLCTALLEAGRQVEVLLGPVEVERRVGSLFAGTGVTLVTTPAVDALARRLARARLFVGNDSGVSHLAAAVGCPLLVLFGPTDPAVWAPRGPHVHVLAAEKAGGSRAAIHEIPFERVIQAVAHLLAVHTD